MDMLRQVNETELDEGRDLLGLYFRDLGGIAVMKKEEELAAAERIAGLRTAFWGALLAHAPFVAAICELIEASLPAGGRPDAGIKAIRKAVRGRGDAGALARAREELALEMSRRDVDGVIADRILADLTALELGQPCASLKLKPAEERNAPPASLLAAARRTQQALVAAKNAFVRANLRLVISIARRMQRGHMPLQDLIQEGNLGLLKAVDRFDHSRGFRFSTYAAWWIRHSISRAISDKGRTVRLPVHLTEVAGKLARAGREFEQAHGRSASDEELSAITKISLERIARVRRAYVEAPISLEQPLPEMHGLPLVDAIADPEADLPGAHLDDELLRGALEQGIGTLAPIELEILRLRLGTEEGEGLTLQEIGQRYALSRERIRQLQERAIAKLRGEFRRRSLLMS
jgi:RNA polymerase primary sigma factor